MPDAIKMRRADFYPADWIAGTLELTLEEEGAYIRICALIYSKGQSIPDHDRWLAGMCRVSMRKWRSLRRQLLDKGKITVEDGLIHQKRCEIELENAAKRARKQAESGSKGGRKSAERRAKALTLLETGEASAAARLKPARAYHHHHHHLSSEAKASGGEQQGVPAASIDPAAVVFSPEPGGCLHYLLTNGVSESNARNLLGKWRGNYGDGGVIEIVTAASRNSVSAPVPWITKALRHRFGSQEQEVGPI